MIPVLKPTCDNWTKAKLLEVIDSGWWGSGKITLEFEAAFAKRIGAKHAIATCSGTAALDLCLKAYDLTWGELITTPITFVSDASVGPWNGLRVTFADVDEESLCLDPATIQPSEDTKAIIAVHSHGRLADIAGIRARFQHPEGAEADRPLIIEDCAHAMHTPGAGRLGDIAIWSFQAVKTLPAGDGGMVTTDSDEIAQKVRRLTWLGIEKSTFQRTQGKGYNWDYDIAHDGTKSYMNDLNASIALGGLRRIDELLAKRQRIQKTYNHAFKNLPGVKIPAWSHTCQYYTLKTDNRDTISTMLAEDGIATSVHFKPLHHMTAWKKSARYPLPVADRVWLKLLSLPCHDALTAEEQEYVIQKFIRAVMRTQE